MEDTIAYQMMMIRNDIVAYCNSQLQTIGITQGQLFFLLYVGKHDACTLKELASALHMDHGHVTRTITKLVEQEFMLQYPHPFDKRSRLLSLTEKGKEAFIFSRSLFQSYDDKLFENMDEEAKHSLSAIANHIRKRRRKQDETSHCI